MSRALFNEINKETFQRMEGPIKQALVDAKKEPSDIDDVVLVGGSTRIPFVQDMLQTLFKGKPLNKDINPDEAVAWGASVQAAKLGGTDTEALAEMVLLDVTPLSLGIETRGGVMSVILLRNTTVPVTKTKKFTTHTDMQTSVRIQVYEGERPMTKDNNLLGNFKLDGITPAPIGVAQIEVSFSVDSNGILNVSALEKGGGKQTNITIQNDIGRLSKEEIAEMIQKAEKLKIEDEKEQQRVQSRLDLESYCLKMQSVFRRPEAKGKLDGAQMELVFTRCSETLSWIDAYYNASKEEFTKKYRETHEIIDGIRKLMLDAKKECCDDDFSAD